jgi:hypothetical protein
MDGREDIEMEGDGSVRNEDEKNVQVYLPGQPLKEDEELICDESAYVMLHEVQTGKNSTRGFRVQTIMPFLIKVICHFTKCITYK